MDSILTSIKKLLGIPEEYTQFDTDIIIHINSALMALSQLGVGEGTGKNVSYSITGATETWTDLFTTEPWVIESVKTYIYLKVRLVFDPPTSSAVIEAINRQIGELEYRILIVGDMINGQS